MREAAFKDLLSEKVRGVFFLRGALDPYLVSGQIDEIIREAAARVCQIQLKERTQFVPVFTFEIGKGNHLKNIKMIINREVNDGLIKMSELGLYHVLVTQGQKRYSALIYQKVLEPICI